jgi:hypothetical protein
LRRGGQVDRHGLDLGAVRPGGGAGQRVQPRLVHVGDDHPGARPGQAEGDRLADPARARDQRGAAGKSKPVRHSEQ